MKEDVCTSCSNVLMVWWWRFFVLDCAMVNPIFEYLDDPTTQDQIAKGQVGFIYKKVLIFWSISLSEVQIAVVKLVHEVCVCAWAHAHARKWLCVSVYRQEVFLDHSSSYISDKVSDKFS